MSLTTRVGVAGCSVYPFGESCEDDASSREGNYSLLFLHSGDEIVPVNENVLLVTQRPALTSWRRTRSLSVCSKKKKKKAYVGHKSQCNRLSNVLFEREESCMSIFH